jgi:hypothetical protein
MQKGVRTVSAWRCISLICCVACLLIPGPVYGCFSVFMDNSAFIYNYMSWNIRELNNKVKQENLKQVPFTSLKLSVFRKQRWALLTLI